MIFLHYKALHISMAKSLIVFAMLLFTAICALLLTPKLQSSKPMPDFEQVVPKQIGDWKEILNPYAQVSLTVNNDDPLDSLYDQVLMRTYRNSAGDEIMLAVAYAHEQKQDVKIHRPEVCYVAQGFQLIRQNDQNIDISSSKAAAFGKRLLMRNQNRYEAVSYWIRVGDAYPSTGLAARWLILKEGLKGKVLDGILVRVSTALSDETGAAIAYDKQENFLKLLAEEVSQANPKLLTAD